MATSDSDAFSTEGDFCAVCGAILMLDKITKQSCVMCKNTTSCKELIGTETSYVLDFTPLGHYASIKKQEKKNKKSKDENEDGGQMDNDRECQKCGHLGMSYTTMQLRSADEGQTVFYLCPKCKSREVENS